MSEHRGGSFYAKRKPGLHIASDRINPHHPMNRPYSPHFSRESNNGYLTGTHHVPVHHRPRGRGFNGPPSFRSSNFKGNFNRYAPQPTGNVPPKHNQTLLRPNQNSTNSSSRTGRGNNQPKPTTFVCEGIEVNFDSSDSEEEVRPWKIVKVLKKNGGVTKNTLQVGSVKAEVNRRQKVNPRVQGKTLSEHDTLDKDQSDDEVQVLSPPPPPTPPDPMTVPETSKRPSFVILSGLGKRTMNTFKPINNCAIIKRPRFLLSQPVPRPSIGPPAQTRVSLPAPPRLQVKPQPQQSGHNINVDLTLEESRIIDDVLDMTEEVEMRARFLNYRYP